MSIANCKTFEDAWNNYRANVEAAGMGHSDEWWSNHKTSFYYGANTLILMLNKAAHEHRNNPEASDEEAIRLSIEIRKFLYGENG